MSEAALLELKGPAQSTAAVGTKKVYNWPDMQVTVRGGKVERFKNRNPEAERRSAQEREAIVAKRQKDFEESQPGQIQYVEIIQIVEGGALVDLLEQNAPVIVSSSLAARGGGGSVYVGPTTYRLSGKTLFVTGMPSNCVDGDRLKVTMAPTGRYSYTDVRGARRTVARFKAIEFTKPEDSK